MSVQTAFQFIQQLRDNDGLKAQLLSHHPTPELEKFVKIGAELGLIFSVEELEAAHKHDWGMRCFLQTTQLKDDR